MKPRERTVILALAAIMAGRMLGLFMLLPVFALYIKTIPGATPALIGLALGIYGLTQGFFQIPFGMLSDTVGRKPMIAIGLILFILGSLIAALSSSITGIIIGRALQGSGAIGSTVLAMAADLTRDEKRTQAMALLGATIGFSFVLAFILGSLINTWFHLSGIFWVTLIGAVISLVLLYTVVPVPPKPVVDPQIEAKASRFKTVVKNPILLRLDFSIFALHSLLTALFMAIPILLVPLVHGYHQALYYLAILILSFGIALPCILFAEKKQKMKSLFIAAIVVLTLCPLALWLTKPMLFTSGLILLLFFSAVTLLEATLPSWISKAAPIDQKGSAMGIYSSSQFLGIFVGGSLGGLIFGYFHLSGIFIFCIVVGLSWLLLAITLPHPPYFATVTLSFKNESHLEALNQALHNVAGIVEIATIPEEQIIYIKINKKFITEDELRNRIRQGTLR